MKKNIALILIMASTLLIEGCAAPGSSIGSLKVRGSLVSSTDKPIPNQDIEFILPATYGLGGLDLVMNSPEDFGHKDQRFKVTTDENGEFEQDLGTHVYHVSCWLLPPVGCFPKRPPAPFVLARFPDNEKEYYAIQSYDGEFKVYSLSGQEIPLSESLLKSLSASNTEGENTETRETIGVIKLTINSE